MTDMQCENCAYMVYRGDDHLMECTYDGWSDFENYIEPTAPMIDCGRMFGPKYEEPVKLNHIEKRLAAIT